MGVIEALSEKFYKDHFVLQYLEMGMGFCGEASFSDGSVVDNQSSEEKEVAKFAKEIFGYEDQEDEE